MTRKTIPIYKKKELNDLIYEFSGAIQRLCHHPSHKKLWIAVHDRKEWSNEWYSSCPQSCICRNVENIKPLNYETAVLWKIAEEIISLTYDVSLNHLTPSKVVQEIGKRRDRVYTLRYPLKMHYSSHRRLIHVMDIVDQGLYDLSRIIKPHFRRGYYEKGKYKYMPIKEQYTADMADLMKKIKSLYRYKTWRV
jgi:hypothetical protein